MKIDYSQYKCPKNPKHALRKSSMPNYCDVWCDHCKDGWKIENLAAVKVSQATELLIYNQCSRSEYPFLFLKIANDLKAKLLKAKETVLTLDPTLSISMPEKEIFKDCLAIEYNGLFFKDDMDEDYKDEVESKLRFSGIVKVDSLKKELDNKNMDSQKLKDFSPKPLFLVATHRGFKIVNEDLDSGFEQINTVLIPWEVIN